MDMVDLMMLRQGGVYCLVNEGEKMVQVFASRNMMDSLNHVMKKMVSREYGELGNHVNDVHLSILQLDSNEENLKVLHGVWVDKYRNNGYKLYKEGNYVSYKVKHGPGIIGNKMRYLVYLEKSRKTRIVLGVFDTKEEAMLWSNKAYPNDIITTLVFCENSYLRFTNYML